MANLRNVARGLVPWQVALLGGTCLISGYFLLPHGGLGQSVYYNAITIAFTALILVGIRLYRPADALTWWLFVVGNLLSIAADCISTLYIARAWELPFPSYADALYLAAYPFLFAAVARFGKGAARNYVRERRLDALIIAMGALVLSWHPLIEAYAGDTTLTLVGKLTLIAYPVMDIAMLYVILTTVVFGGRRKPVDLLVGTAIIATVVGDFAYDVLELHGAYADGHAIDVTWLLDYLLLGVAALHPSMADLTSRPAVVTPRRWWLVMTGIASFVPPAYLLVGTALHQELNVAALAGLALVMAILGATRMGLMFGTLRERADQLRTRSRALQQALTERDALEEDLRHRAFHDVLTGLANRALLHERIDRALARSRGQGSGTALVLCDLDGFKTVNDSLGHQVGDELLAVTAQRLMSAVRPGDTVARLGGDEFAALLDGVPDARVAQSIAARIVASLREPVMIGGDAIAVSASVGVTMSTAQSTAEQLTSDADAAMYEAKGRGKNRYVVFEEPMRARAMERLTFTTAFAGALERSEFYLDFQPCFSLGDGHLRSFEALVRWRHPTMGLVAPQRFIQLAEETGFILPLGRWVLESACTEAASWPARADGSPTVAVNVSLSQLTNLAFADDVRRALATSGLPGDRLVLEVTEGSLMQDESRAVAVLNELRTMGVRVAIDDFGVGYSSLSRLDQLPIDFVKIDKSFVNQIGDGAKDGRPMVQAILRLARDLNLATVAEGIEVEAQRAALTAMGCDDGQGYLLSHPIDGTAAAALAARYGAEVNA